MNVMKDALQQIRARFDVQWEHEQRRDLYQLGLPSRQALPALTWLKEHSSFVELKHYTIVDWLEEGEFQVTYLLSEPETAQLLMIETRIPRESAVADSIHKLWPQAVTYEQEMAEMFGVDFPGSPRVGKDFCLEGWKDTPPMRRDFDTVAFVEASIPERPGRKTINTREYIGEKAKELRLLND